MMKFLSKADATKSSLATPVNYPITQEFARGILHLLILRDVFRDLIKHLSMMKGFFCENTAQKMKYSIKDFFGKSDQICSLLRIWTHLQKKSSMENFIF